MTSKTTSFIVLKSQKCRTCYAGRGLRSGPPRWGYPSHRYRGGPHSAHEAADGYAAPKVPAGQPCLDDELFPWLTTLIWHWPKQKNAEWYCGKLRCHSTNGIAITRHVNMEQLSCLRRLVKVFWFSTLLTTAIRRYVLIIRKLAD